MIFFKPSRIAEPKILEFSQSIPFRSTSSLNNNLSNSIPNLSSSSLNHSSITGEQSNFLGHSLPILLTCTVFSTERVQRKWTLSKSSNDSSDSLIVLDHESDGSLLISGKLHYIDAIFENTYEICIFSSFINFRFQFRSIAFELYL